jgi:hypothetical protein
MNERRQSCGGKPRAPAAAGARGAPQLGPGATCGGHHGRGESLPVPPTHEAWRGHGETTRGSWKDDQSSCMYKQVKDFYYL